MGIETMALVASGVTAGAQVLGGLGEAQAMKERAKLARYNARMSELRATQISATRKEELNKVLATTQTIAGSSGIDLSSSTLLTLKKKIRQDSRDQENAEVLGERVRGVGFRTEASNLRRGSTMVAVTGLIRGLGTAAGGYSEYKAATG
ncbi:MAG: hypothetical protein ACX94B_12970 [Henriciella sp.]